MPTDNHFGLSVSADMKTSVDRVVVLTRGFLRWWHAELLALVPERLRQLSRHKDRLVLMVGEESGSATVFIDGAGASEVLARIAEPGSADARAAVQAVLHQPKTINDSGRGALGLCLRLPSRCALRREIDLPLAAEGNISEVIGYELDRYTPFRAEQVYFCYRVVTRDPAAHRLVVEIVVVPKTVVDDALRTASELGWVPERVDVADPRPGAICSDNLLATSARSRPRNGARATFGLAAAAAVLTVSAVVLPFANAERQAAALRAAAAAIENQAQVAATLRKEIKVLRNGDDFLAARKRRSPTVSRLLAEITHLLPDNTWLTELRITGIDVELTGVSASASALIGILEHSKLFRDTSFRSPVIPDPRSGRERFSIAARIVTEPQR